MITEEEYLNAVSIIAEFQKQIQRDISKLDIYKRIERKTNPKDWVKWSQCSARLKRALLYVCSEQTHTNWRTREAEVWPPQSDSIEDVEYSMFKRVSDIGKGTWLEFEELRGF